MVRTLTIQTVREITQTSTWGQELPIDCYVQVYPRVSTPEQKKNVSAEMQQDKSFALLCGWKDEHIIMDTADLGLSGQLPMEERPAFVKMLIRIADGTIKAVIAAQVDRLFRDRWGKEYSKFMEICYLYGVKVITPNHSRSAIDFVYDFSISWHVDKFRRKCEEAWSYIENHIGRMQAAREELTQAGYWAGSGGIATGYVADMRERVNGRKNPNYRKLIPYPPHVEKMAWLYAENRRLANNTNDLFREIQTLEFLFPPFDKSLLDEGIVARCQLKKVYDVLNITPEMDEEDWPIKGYTIASPSGLRWLLSNPVYAGYWIHHNQIICSDNHDPIVPYGDFIYAFNHLSPTNLDGTPNTDVLERREKYVKRYYPDRPVLLANQIEAASDDFTIYTRTDRGHNGRVITSYAFYPNKLKLKRTMYSIPTSELDDIFLKHFIQRLQATDTYDNFLEFEAKVRKSAQEARKEIEAQIKGIESLMAKIKADVRSGQVTNVTLLGELNDKYTELEGDLAHQKARLENLYKDTTQAQQRRTYKQMMRDAGDCWEEVVLPEEIPMMIDSFVQKVVIDALSPRFYTMAVHWRDPEWGVDEAICFRNGNPSVQWTDEEREILVQYGQTITRTEIIQLLPNRSYHAIKRQIRIMGLRRPQLPSEAICYEYSVNDRKVMEKYGIDETELEASQDENFARWY